MIIEQYTRLPAECESCKAFAPECWVPDRHGGASALCWLCAHHVADHESTVQTAQHGECECTPEQVYPADVLAKRRAQQVASPPGRFQRGRVTEVI